MNKVNHIIESQQFTPDFIEQLFATADTILTQGPVLQGKVMASLFYEPSTRTRFSFESAMLRLGGGVISTENAKEFSSAIKGETLEDSIKTISNYADVIVLRHSEQGASQRAAGVSTVPVINAGDGAGQHPTQALLDLYTIKKEVGVIEGIAVALVGDLKHGRTVHSLVYLLAKYPDVQLHFVSPKELRIGEDLRTYLHKKSVRFVETEDLEQVAGLVDVLYQTRIQAERFDSKETYLQFKGCYQIDTALVEKMKDKAIIMHPLPRVDEILPEVDQLPQAVYFRQVAYGVQVRMALLVLLS